MNQPAAEIYRKLHNAQDLFYFNIRIEETDLHIGSVAEIRQQAETAVTKYRNIIKDYIKKNANFAHSMTPLACAENSPAIIKEMCLASQTANVGPMAAVAGAIAQFTGQELSHCSEELIIENGGDIFITGKKDRLIGIYAGDSPFSNKIALKIPAGLMPLGICTSAGTHGHSFSQGKADAAIVISKNTILADALATAFGNRITASADLNDAMEYIKTFADVIGAFAIVEGNIAAYGCVELEII